MEYLLRNTHDGVTLDEEYLKILKENKIPFKVASALYEKSFQRVISVNYFIVNYDLFELIKLIEHPIIIEKEKFKDYPIVEIYDSWRE